ncbi:MULTISPECIES: DUF3146 family protein [Prochlorococcus]|uniref:DUF3146 domain-containing protein n=1 Tax=Prochlorococcus marinus (strain SARG / CCMP1375 / SS120) TaxID=167539 RepID=Q7VDT8_PROMA|nr:MULTISPECIES: DUF3146 family protein [Prochlorococcus]AAP99326.1 Uncharacterized protein Pro_0280 [Prochlorococcus marinus subsp. marinus str. CCMP1375]
MHQKPSTTAHLRVFSQNFATKCMAGEVSAGEFNWQFNWKFSNGELLVEPPLGRALIKDALLRFLVKTDYYLEPGGDYNFTIRAKF